MPSESVIRDKLSRSLAVLEHGLKLVETNHKLPNRIGSKGFIDILARDRYGNFVIIELKRSDQSAREALNEILKYMPLFRDHHGIEPHQVRCFIVSTTWRELLVPYSEFRRLCECQTEGIEIEVNTSGKVLKAKRVDVHSLDEVAAISQTHSVYLYRNVKERNAAASEIRAALEKVGVTGYLMLQMDCKNPRIIYPFAVYVVPTKVAPAITAKLTRRVKRNLGPDASNAVIERSYRDGLLLESLSKHMIKQPRSREWTHEGSSAMKFVSLIEQQSWVVRGIDRKGPFRSAVVMPDLDIVELLKGFKGENPVRFDRLVSPSLKLDWPAARAAASNCLGDNPVWVPAFNWFFDRVEIAYPDANVHAHVFNPRLLPEVLYHLVTEVDPSYIPMMHIEATSRDGQHHEAILGTITWDGKTKPKAVKNVFSVVPGGLEGYYMARVCGEAWALDRRLMRRHGLTYAAWRITYGTRGAKVEKQLLVSRTGRVRETKTSRHPRVLTDFVMRNEPYIRDLIAATDGHVIRM